MTEGKENVATRKRIEGKSGEEKGAKRESIEQNLSLSICLDFWWFLEKA